MKKVLIIGNLASPLIRDRVLLSKRTGYNVLVLDFYNVSVKSIDGVRIKTFVNNRVLIKLLAPFLLIYYIAVYKPNVIHVHWALQDFNSFVLIWLKNVIVSTMGSDIMPEVKHDFIRVFFLKLLLKKSKYVTSKSLYMKKVLLEHYDISDKKIKILKWGLDKIFFKEYKKENFLNLNISRHKKIFLCLRAMQPLYRKQEILDAFIKYKKVSGSTSVLIVSKFSADKKYLAKIEETISKSDCRNDIFLIDTVEHHQIPRLLNYVDYIVMFPVSDGMPQSLYESMVFGKFLIVPELDHYKEILIHKKNAYFADELTLVDAFNFAEYKSDKIIYERFNKKYAKYFLTQDKQIMILKYLYDQFK